VKKYIFLCALVVATCFFVTSQASAVTVGQLFNPNGPNQISDEDRGYLIDRQGAVPGQVDIGDSIRGHLNFNTLNSGGANLGGTTGNSELTAVYQLLIVDKIPLGGGNFNFVIGPDPVFQTDLGGGQTAVPTGFVPGDTDGDGAADSFGVMAVLFEDFAGNVDFTGDYDDPAPSIAPPADPASQAVPGNTTPGINDDGTFGVLDTFGNDDRNDSLGAGSPNPTPPSAADISGAVGPAGPYRTEEDFISTAYTVPGVAAGPERRDPDSVHFLTIGFTGQPGEGALATFNAGPFGPGDNFLNNFLLTSGTSGGNVNFAFNTILFGPAWPGYQVNTVTPSPFGGTVDFAGSQQIRGVSDLDTPFEFSSNTNLSFNTTAIPEPATLLLIGGGLIGLAALGRRRRKA
jgi:hypothetical protein